ncbi:MAG: DUF885 family protein [Bacteroidota bacterium]
MLRLLLFCCCFLGTACQHREADFEQFWQRYQQARWVQFPDWASSAGQVEAHAILVIPSAAKRTSDRQFCQRYLDTLTQFDPQRLSPDWQSQYLALSEQLNGYLQQLDTAVNYASDPSYYNVKGSFQHVLQQIDLPLENKLRLLYTKMQSVPQYYETAKSNLQSPDRLTTQKAIHAHEATFQFFYHSLPDSLQVAQWSSQEQERFQRVLLQAQLAIKSYVAFCQSIEFEFAQLDNQGMDSKEEE